MKTKRSRLKGCILETSSNSTKHKTITKSKTSLVAFINPLAINFKAKRIKFIPKPQTHELK